MLTVRQELKEHSILGEYGAVASTANCSPEAERTHPRCARLGGFLFGAVRWMAATAFAARPRRRAGICLP